MEKEIFDLSIKINLNKNTIKELQECAYFREPFEIEVNKVAELELENFKLKQQLDYKLTTLANQNETK
jgi:hypothetical protein